MEGKLVGDCHCHHRLVPSGYCDIAGHITSCSHCQKPNQPEKEDWEAEFDKRTNANHKPFSESLLYGDNEPESHPDSMYELDFDKVKSFIRNLLAQQKEEIIKELEGMKKRYVRLFPSGLSEPEKAMREKNLQDREDEYNKALDDCIEAIKQM